MSFDSTTFKIVVVGDGAIGKTCMLVTYTRGTFPEEYIPTTFDTYNKDIVHDYVNFQLGLWDTAGQEDFDQLRPLSYSETDLFIIAYDVTSTTSFDNIRTKWFPDVSRYENEDRPRDAPPTLKMLVGLKSDLRRDPSFCRDHEMAGKEFVDARDAADLQKQTNAFCSMECSARTGENLSLIFEEAIAMLVRVTKARARGPPDTGLFSSVSAAEDLDDDIRMFME